MNTPLFIKKDGRLYRVLPKDIICLEADRAYCKIYVVGYVEPFRLSYAMGTLLRAFPEDLLTTVGRSLSLNLSHIREVGDCSIMMDGNHRFSTSVNAIKTLKESLNIIG